MMGKCGLVAALTKVMARLFLQTLEEYSKQQ